MDARGAVEAVYRESSRRVLATLIRLLGGFDAAEEALHEAFAAAAEQWPRDGVPANPVSWLVSTGRFKTIDRWRRQGRLEQLVQDGQALFPSDVQPMLPEPIPDDDLRLIFTCCHPALAPDARVALTLREVGGLTTEEIARAYMVPAPTIAQRIVRAKGRIRDDAIPYEVPGRQELPARVESVLRVLYLIFNEGYAATESPSLTRPELCSHAVRLARLTLSLLDEPEVRGLLALMLLHTSRARTRQDGAGDLVLLEDQDRSLWDRARIQEAQDHIDHAMQAGAVGPYVVQAAIASLHAHAPCYANTDWTQITALYDVLLRLDPSPVVALNRGVAISMRDGPAAGLLEIERLMGMGKLDGYALAHAAQADLLRRLGRQAEARDSYTRALALTRQPAERRFLQARLEQLGPTS